MSAAEEDPLRYPRQQNQYPSPQHRQRQVSFGTWLSTDDDELREDETLLSNSPVTETLLPSLAYAQSPPSVNTTNPLSLNTQLHHHHRHPPASSTRLQAFATDVYGQDDSPVDPHNFYRPFQDPFTADTGAPLDTMRIPPPRKSGPTTSRENLITPRHTRSTWERKNSGLTSKSPSVKSTSSSSTPMTLSGSSKLQHLVDRFNQKTDDALPIPGQRVGAATAKSGSPVMKSSKTSGASATRSAVRNDTGKKDSERAGVNKDRHQLQTKPAKNAITTNGTGTSRTSDMDRAVATPKHTRSGRSKISEANNQWASHSTSALHHPQNDSVRRPLFGEVLDLSSSTGQAGFGIEPIAPRGSEGASRPSIAHRRAKSHIESPSSPTAWYLGADYSSAPSRTRNDEPPVIRPPHRRAKSDFARNPSISEDLPDFDHYSSSPTLGPDERKEVTEVNHTKPHSRIPLRTRQRSVPTNIGTAPSGTQASQGYIKSNADKGSTTRAHGAAHKTSGKSSDMVTGRSNTPLSPRSSRYDVRDGSRAVTSPSLKAYISTPTPTRSPPLRSSRPRLPVSAASTSASRAKMVPRHGGSQQDQESVEAGRRASDATSRPKNIPELGAVDFAARRERIQRAFTKSVKDGEIQVSRRREQSVMQHDAQTRMEDERHADQAFGAQNGHDTKDGQNLPELKTVEIMSVESEPKVNEESEQLQSAADIENITPPDEEENRNQAEQELAGTKGDADSDRADQESIRIILEPSPITQAKLEDGDGHQWDDVVKETETIRDSEPDAVADSVTLPAQQTQPTEQHVEIGVSDNDDSITFAQERKHDVGSFHGDITWSPCTLPTPQTGNSVQDGSTYSAINRILEQYHQTDISSPGSLRDFQQRLLTESPELARLGGWDPEQIIQLPVFLQGLCREALDSPAPTPELPVSENKAEEEPRSEENEYIEADHSVTDIDSDGFGVGRGEGKPSYQPSEGDWSRASLEINEGSPVLHRASLRSKIDWEDASPSIADWMQPQAERSPDSEPQLFKGPTPPPKEPVSPVEFQNSVAGCLQSEGSLLDREGAATPRLSMDGPPQLSEARSTGEGLGLAINVDEQQNVPILPPPPLPNHAPPPPPVVASSDEDTGPAPERFQGPRSPPSPSIYSRYPPSSIFPTASADDFRIQTIPTSSFRASDLSTPLQPIFTPSGPQTRSTSSTHSRDATNLEHPFGQTADMTSATPVPGPEQARLAARRNVIKELLDTESTYFRDMNIIVAIYKGSAKDSTMTAEDITVLFGNMDQVAAFTQTFFDALRQAGSSVYVVPRDHSHRRTSASTAASSATEDRLSMTGTDMTDDDRDRRTFIGEVFGQYLARMEKVYGDYLKNHDAANKKLEELQHRPGIGIKVWLEQCHAAAHDMTNAWSLDSLLVKPVQRLLKYPLLLTELIKCTQENHPDYTALEFALREIKAVSLRINNQKKRAELVEKVLKRKRKESDVRSGLSKALGRRTEKLKQHVGLSETKDDHAYKEIEGRLDEHIAQLHVTMKDIEDYLTETQGFVDRFQLLIQTIESYIDICQSGHLEMESKWRKFGIATRELSAVALAEHKTAVETHVIEPMRSLSYMYQRPQVMVQQRSKSKVDYARFRAIKARGDKPDKRTQEEMDTFVELTDTLKEELPRLYAGTGKLVRVCLMNFVDIQIVWQATWKVKLKSILDEHQITASLREIVDQCLGDFAITEAEALSLGICNGSVLAQTPNFLSPASIRLGDDYSFKRPSISSSRSRAISLNSNSPPQAYSPSDPTFMSYGSSGYLVSPTSDSSISRSRYPIHQGNQSLRLDRTRAGSTLSNPSYMGEGMMPTPPAATRSFSAVTTSSINHPNGTESHRPSTSTTRSVEITLPPPFPLSTRQGGALDSPVQTRPASGSTYPTDLNHQIITPTQRPFSGFFSSAMPMSDNNTPRTASPRTSRPTSPFGGRDGPRVLFAVASTAEFNVDRSRSEAGYPYLTYVKGEVFDVVAEKGELWLAMNQDDHTHQIGWIWSKHFVKLVVDDQPITS